MKKEELIEKIMKELDKYYHFENHKYYLNKLEMKQILQDNLPD